MKNLDKEVNKNLNAEIIEDLMPFFTGNLFQALIMDSNITNKVIDEYAEQFTGALIDDIEKKYNLELPKKQKEDVEKKIKNQMKSFVKNSFKEMKSAADQVYKEHNISKEVSLGDAAVMLKEKKNINLPEVMHSKTSFAEKKHDKAEEKNSYAMLKLNSFINQVKKTLGIKQSASDQIDKTTENASKKLVKHSERLEQSRGQQNRESRGL